MQKRVLRETPAIQGLFISLPKGQDGAMTIWGDNDSTLHEARGITAAGNELLVTVVSGKWEDHIGDRVNLSFRAFDNLYCCDATIARWEEDSRILALTMITEISYMSLEADEEPDEVVPVRPVATMAPQGVSVETWLGSKTAVTARIIVWGVGCLAVIGLMAIIAVTIGLYLIIAN